VTFPAEANEPKYVLRAFAQTGVLQPGASATLSFSLTRRDLSIWARRPEGSGGWRLVFGRFLLSVGAGSRDLRLTHPLRLEERDGSHWDLEMPSGFFNLGG